MEERASVSTAVLGAMMRKKSQKLSSRQTLETVVPAWVLGSRNGNLQEEKC